MHLNTIKAETKQNELKMAKLQIIGTSHIARESISTIRNKILDKQPGIVAVELDASRVPYLFGKKSKPKLTDIKRIGVVGFVFSLIGGFVQRKLGERVGLAPGADIRAAIRAAKRIGAKVYLIDRPIAKSLQRLSETMTFWEKLKFVGYLLGGFLLPAPKELRRLDLARVPEERLIVTLTSELNKKFPHIYNVLVRERDRYMAEKLKQLMAAYPHERIIAVIGAGHVKGIKKHLKH